MYLFWLKPRRTRDCDEVAIERPQVSQVQIYALLSWIHTCGRWKATFDESGLFYSVSIFFLVHLSTRTLSGDIGFDTRRRPIYVELRASQES